ncbi:MAG: MBL fold metallo-hydrolase [Armatimonadota bacterium]|nr:MBL fold metallo-hydrolase [Armatimonadota bacterium]
MDVRRGDHHDQDFVQSRRVGDAVISVISEGSFWWAPRFAVPEAAWREAMPDADATGQIPIDCNLVHISLGAASVVVDPGFDDPDSTWGRAFGARWSGFKRTPGLHAALTGLGVHADDITHVLITHTHEDHFAGVVAERNGQLVPRFPRARYYVADADWLNHPRRGDPAAEIARRLGVLEAHGLLHTVHGEHEIAPGVTMVPAPGETPGHSAVRVRSGGQAFYYVGDLFHHPCEVAHPDWVSPGRDAAIMRASRERLSREATDSHALVVFSHERFPAWGRIVKTDGGYRWERAGW